MEKITKLTRSQEERIPVLRNEVFRLVTSAKRADLPMLELAISDAYSEIGKASPLVVILQSPMQAMMAIRFMQESAKKEAGHQLSRQFSDQLRSQLREQLWDQLSRQLWDQLSNQLRDQIWGQLCDQLCSQLRRQLGNNLRSQLWWEELWNDHFLWGSQDLYWIALGKFAEEIGAILTDTQCKRLDVMYRIGAQCEWWWPYEGICFVSERSTDIRWDDSRRLHSETGPAVLYEDGYSLYAWHGTRIPEQWIADKAFLTPEIALAVDNAEQRRAACEIIGWEKLLSLLGARLLDKDEDDMVGQLYEVNHDALGGHAKFLRMYCPTGRWFAEPVPMEMNTALEANAWGFDIPPDLYKIRVQA